MSARVVDRTTAIRAPVEVVWKALTDATELTRWFPLRASVTPGPGGVIHMAWGESYDADSRIEIWEPPHHLRISFPHHPPVRLATDHFLSGDRGHTVLRVVTSGFGDGGDWDDWYAGVGAGWDFELLGLKHYLEHHHGLDRLVASATHPLTIPREVAWERLTESGGWLDRTGLSGTTLHRQPPVQLVTTVDQLNNGLLRIELEFGNRVIAWLATWGAPADSVARIEREWRWSLAAALA